MGWHPPITLAGSLLYAVRESGPKDWKQLDEALSLHITLQQQGDQ